MKYLLNPVSYSFSSLQRKYKISLVLILRNATSESKNVIIFYCIYLLIYLVTIFKRFLYIAPNCPPDCGARLHYYHPCVSKTPLILLSFSYHPRSLNISLSAKVGILFQLPLLLRSIWSFSFGGLKRL